MDTNSDAKYGAFTILTVDELLQKEITEPEWIVEGLIPSSGLIALSGDPGNGKTWIALGIAKSVASGTPLFGEFKVKEGGVLYIDEENGVSTLNPRVLKLGVDKNLPINFLIKQGVKVDRPNDVSEITKIVEEKNIRLIIVDPLAQVHDGDENTAQSMAKVVGKFKVLTNLGASVLFLHHHRKENANNFRSSAGNKLRGSSVLFAAVDSHITITKDEDVILIEQSKSRQSKEIEPFSVRLMVEEGDSVRLEYLGKISKRSSFEEKSELIQEFLSTEERSRQQIIDGLNAYYGADSLDKALKLSVDRGLLKMRRGASNEHFYSLP